MSKNKSPLVKRPLKKETIDRIFEEEAKKEKPNHGNILFDLVKLAIPDFDQIEAVNHFPKISHKTNNYLFGKFIDFDKQFHPKASAGFLWMNHGFSSADDKFTWDWIVEIDTSKIQYPEALPIAAAM